ncbi:CBS domain-containing protein [Rugosimonospora africana]|uniref:CBS domain-containing protein n=1 Tax=Rugosimonospora africana TaxID=556532 RepID=A0A8J3VW94_9ACTN|nr:CBS domain-containing protein [Rugosimonospora africana]GIH21100.1 hypothetical protein Raf01_92720 [Rugosimonospora africana]
MSRTHVVDVMTSRVISAPGNASYRQLVALLTEHCIGGVPVVDAMNRVIGVVSEADLIRRLAPNPRRRWWWPRSVRPAASTARDLMTESPVLAMPSTTVDEAVRRMRAANVKRLPVVDELGVLVGIVARSDVLRTFLRDDGSIQSDVVDGVLARDFLLGPGSVDAQVTDGVVTLRGQLSNQDLIDLVASEIGQVEGVIAVENRLLTTRT